MPWTSLAGFATWGYAAPSRIASADLRVMIMRHDRVLDLRADRQIDRQNSPPARRDAGTLAICGVVGRARSMRGMPGRPHDVRCLRSGRWASSGATFALGAASSSHASSLSPPSRR
jgi:hypothetical protein